MAIYHIAFARDWELARASGEYTTSTLGRSLADQGFIHASDAHQVALVANFIFAPYAEDAAQGRLLVLVIDVDRLESEVRYERAADSDDPFPHIYGPVNADAVVATAPLTLTPDGTFTFTPPA